LSNHGAAGPPPELLYRHRPSLLRATVECWQARGVAWALAERQLRARYKQALLGFTWALAGPVAILVAFDVVFTRVAKVSTGGAPYALFSYLGLIVWTFFSGAVSVGATSIIGNVALINKIYCPREVFPISAVLLSTFDTLVALVALVVLFPLTGFAPKGASFWVVIALPVMIADTVGWSLIVAVLVVYLRDIRSALPLALQLGVFATPVAFGLQVIPARWRNLYSFLNPLGPVIDDFRRGVLGGRPPDWGELGYGAVGALVVLVGGYWMFKRMESGIADLA
jgi:ABC-type polysaccharide/polyol phosphate export permease